MIYGSVCDKTMTLCCDDKTIVANTTFARSVLNKKYLALVDHFCRECFTVNVDDVWWVIVQHNMSDDMTKSLRIK